MKNEKTGARIAKIAARALRTPGIWVCYNGQGKGEFVHISDEDFRACMASLVTQSPAKPSPRVSTRLVTARRPQAKNAGKPSKPKRGKNAKIGPFIQRRGLKKPPRISPRAKVWSA